jgi:hypothetical protein
LQVVSSSWSSRLRHPRHLLQSACSSRFDQDTFENGTCPSDVTSLWEDHVGESSRSWEDLGVDGRSGGESLGSTSGALDGSTPSLFLLVFFDLDQDVCCLHHRPLKEKSLWSLALERLESRKVKIGPESHCIEWMVFQSLLIPWSLSLEKLVALLVSDCLQWSQTLEVEEMSLMFVIAVLSLWSSASLSSTKMIDSRQIQAFGFFVSVDVSDWPDLLSRGWMVLGHGVHRLIIPLGWQKGVIEEGREEDGL